MSISSSSLLALGVVLGALACSGTAERAPVTRSTELTGVGDNAGEVPLPCGEGEVRECSVFIKERAGVVTCAPGFQICESGSWTECDVDGVGGSAGAPSAPNGD